MKQFICINCAKRHDTRELRNACEISHADEDTWLTPQPRQGELFPQPKDEEVTR